MYLFFLFSAESTAPEPEYTLIREPDDGDVPEYLIMEVKLPKVVRERDTHTKRQRERERESEGGTEKQIQKHRDRERQTNMQTDREINILTRMYMYHSNHTPSRNHVEHLRIKVYNTKATERSYNRTAHLFGTSRDIETDIGHRDM